MFEEGGVKHFLAVPPDERKGSAFPGVLKKKVWRLRLPR